MSAVTEGMYVLTLFQICFGQSLSGCYDENGNPRQCMPMSENIAYGLPVEATSTCGTEYCSTIVCKTCDAESHGAQYITDGRYHRSWWQSETMFEGIQYPNVNWVTASAIRISLTRLNTFGDEQIGDDKVLKSYYYAVSDIRVDGRCKCNGHASSCSDNNGSLMCDCEHHTTGKNCERCENSYVDKPWARATDSNPFECSDLTNGPEKK